MKSNTNKTELTLSTKKKKKLVKVDSSSVKSSSSSSSKKLKPRTTEKKIKKLNKAKNIAKIEETAAQELIDKMKSDIKSSSIDENDHRAVYLDMYRQLRRIIRKTERSCLRSKNGQGAYQLATLYTQLRETIADLRSLTDLSDHVDRIVERVVRPLFTTIVQSYADSMYTVKLKIKDRLIENKVKRTFEDIDDITIEAGKQFQAQYTKVVEDIKILLVGDKQ
jgi:hypothetical protein